MFRQDSHWQLLKPEQTVTVKFCSEKMSCLKNILKQKKHLSKKPLGNFLHNNMMQQTAMELEWEILIHTLYYQHH